METKFKFNSQICTDRFQSERLLALGLKKETADCHWYYSDEKWKMGGGCNSIACENLYPKYYVPTWSLGRLIEMLPNCIKLKEDMPILLPQAFLDLTQISVSYYWIDFDTNKSNLVEFYGNGLFVAVVNAIEWLIKEGYFNKEYLV